MNKKILLILLAFSVCFMVGAQTRKTNKRVKKPEATFYDFKATTLMGGDTIKMDSYKGKVVLIVNTASKCGLTPQFEGLEALYKKYKDKGLVILGFPCNQFLSQDPGTSAEIAEFCQVNYGVTFQMFEKIDVNGKNAFPLYDFLKTKFPGKIEWNFAKFLVDKDGNVVKRYHPRTVPADLEKDIEELLQ